VKLTWKMADEAGMILVCRDAGRKLADDRIVDLIVNDCGSTLPRQVIRKMIRFHDQDKEAFVRETERVKALFEVEVRRRSRLTKGEKAGRSGDPGERAKPLKPRAARPGEFRNVIAKCGLRRDTAKLLAAVRFGHFLVAGAKIGLHDAALASRFRGRPAMRPAEPWPTWKRKPMNFLGQIRLSDIPRPAAEVALPHDGLLSFFAVEPLWNYNSGTAGTILVQDSLAGLELRSAPGRVRTHLPRRMKIVTNVLCLPPWESERRRRLHLFADRQRGTASDRYMDLCAELSTVQQLDTPSLIGQPRRPQHLLFGYPDQVQGDIEHDAHEFDRASRHWRLLLQIDSDERICTEWGDVGRIYFMVPEKAFLKGDCRYTCTVLQD
jgi:hypothetical protein